SRHGPGACCRGGCRQGLAALRRQRNGLARGVVGARQGCAARRDGARRGCPRGGTARTGMRGRRLGRHWRDRPHTKSRFPTALSGACRVQRQSGGDEGKPMKILILLLLLSGGMFAAKKKVKPPTPSALDRFVADARARTADAPVAAPGGIWVAGSRLADAARDLRASHFYDMITILVVENASAVASG